MDLEKYQSGNGYSMKRRLLLHYWPVTLVLLTMLISNVILVSFVTVEAINPVTALEGQAAPPASPGPPEAVIIPNTGESIHSSFVNIISSWFLWAILGMGLLFFMIFRMARAKTGSNR